MIALKLIAAAVLIAGVLYAIHRIHRNLSERRSSVDDAGLVSRGIRRVSRDSTNEIERFIAEYHAGTAQAAVSPEKIDPSTEPELGLDVSRPTLTQIAQGPHRLIFLLMKSSFADHHLFPNARLGDFVEGLTLAQQAERVDFLVCDRRFAAVAAVDLRLKDVAAQRQPERRALFEKLGVRYVILTIHPPPRPHQIRSMVLGGVAGPDAYTAGASSAH